MESTRSILVDEIFYGNDCDPWPSGVGEQYVKSLSGDGIYPTEEGYPGNIFHTFILFKTRF